MGWPSEIQKWPLAKLWPTSARCLNNQITLSQPARDQTFAKKFQNISTTKTTRNSDHQLNVTKLNSFAILAHQYSKVMIRNSTKISIMFSNKQQQKLTGVQMLWLFSAVTGFPLLRILKICLLVL